MIFKLDRKQVCYFCAGARNHALLDYFGEDYLRPEYDERMASFKALGLTKVTGLPAIICTTSGTAVSQTVSALLEAKYSNLPLVLISGDRPKKMHGTGAPQTINHEEVTKNSVGTFIEITLEELENLEIIAPVFPLHINVLINDTEEHSLPTMISQTLNDFREFSQKVTSPLFLVSHENKTLRPLVKKLLELNLNVYAETLSGARDLNCTIGEFELLKIQNQFDSVIRIGHTPLSKLWRILESEHRPVFSFDERNLPGLSYGQVAPISGETLLHSQEFFEIIKRFQDTKVNSPCSQLEKLLLKYPQSELSVMRQIQDFLPENSLVYLGNSLIIRYFEMVQNKSFQVFGTRGVNGIDGQIAQSIGIAQGTTEKVFCIVGDMTAQYDLNSIRHLPDNLTLIIINNGGGRIFETLKLKPIMVMEHDFSFHAVSNAFQKTYSNRIDAAQVLELRPLQNETRSLLSELNS
ncbi:MAG TPA: thiamine pyrophosphate-binding protein [Bacteriovoracaceae bacterium]|nr:thiamine pyrophosphate-binding protein [Bacteriovoracaceae bacterium]